MQSTVHILVEGYAHPGKDGVYEASPTSSIIFFDSKTILVDPGTNKDMLLSALKNLKLETTDIDFIFLSHYHPDHFLNLSLFPGIDLYDGTMRWSNDKEYFYDTSGFIPGTSIKLLPTPGHAPEHTSLLVETKEGLVCIAQDVFWWEGGKQQSDNYEGLINYIDPFASDMNALKESRKKVLEVADIIIPGHGRKFTPPRLP